MARLFSFQPSAFGSGIVIWPPSYLFFCACILDDLAEWFVLHDLHAKSWIQDITFCHSSLYDASMLLGFILSKRA